MTVIGVTKKYFKMSKVLETQNVETKILKFLEKRSK